MTSILAPPIHVSLKWGVYTLPSMGHVVTAIRAHRGIPVWKEFAPGHRMAAVTDWIARWMVALAMVAVSPRCSYQVGVWWGASALKMGLTTLRIGVNSVMLPPALRCYLMSSSALSVWF